MDERDGAVRSLLPVEADRDLEEVRIHRDELDAATDVCVDGHGLSTVNNTQSSGERPEQPLLCVAVVRLDRGADGVGVAGPERVEDVAMSRRAQLRSQLRS